jgi:ATP-dependent Lon protease
MCAAVERPNASPSHTSPARDPRPAMDTIQPLTSFVGRTAQLSAVIALVREPGVRLLTLAGPAGVGKTRRCEAAAGSVEDAFADGMRFVSLAAVRDRE